MELQILKTGWPLSLALRAGWRGHGKSHRAGGAVAYSSSRYQAIKRAGEGHQCLGKATALVWTFLTPVR